MANEGGKLSNFLICIKESLTPASSAVEQGNRKDGWKNETPADSSVNLSSAQLLPNCFFNRCFELMCSQQG